MKSMILFVFAATAAGPVRHIPLVPHHVLEARHSSLPASKPNRGGRDRALKGEKGKKQQIDSLYQGYGTHYVDLWVGTPPQRQTVIVGTGSGAIAFPCSGCAVCGELHHTDSYFIEADSTSFSKVPCGDCKFGRCANSINAPDSNLFDECQMMMAYTEGSTWKAFEGVDITYAGGPHDKFQALHPDHPQTEDDVDPSRASSFAFNLTFGCQTYTTGLFSSQLADGIMGMDNVPASFWSQAYANGMIDKKSFSLCLSRQPTASWQGTEAGALTMGGVDKRLHTSPMAFCFLEPGSTFVVDLRKIHLRQGGGGDSAKSNNPSLKILSFNYTGRAGGDSRGKKVSIDSGTTDTYLTKEIAPAFKEAWMKLTGKTYSNSPMQLTEEKLNNLPTILFQLAGDETKNRKIKGAEDPDQVTGLAGSLDPDHPLDVIVAMPPAHYMAFDEKCRMYVPRFYMDELWDPVIGANTMMGHDVNFNEDENHIGWAESHCDYTELVDEFEEEELAKGLPKPGAELKVGQLGVSDRGGVCASAFCRGSFTLVLIALAAAGAVFAVKKYRLPSEAEYQPTAGVEIPDMEVSYRPTHGSDADGVQYSAPSTSNNTIKGGQDDNSPVQTVDSVANNGQGGIATDEN